MSLNLDGFQRPDPADVPAFARYHFRQRVEICLEHYSFDVDNPDAHDWASEIVKESEEYHNRGPDDYLAFVAASYEAGRRARLETDFQLVLDGVSLTGTDRAPRETSEQE